MIRRKVPPVKLREFETFDVERFTKLQGGGDMKKIRDWEPPSGILGRAEEVYDEYDRLLGTLVFVWGCSKGQVNWNQREV